MKRAAAIAICLYCVALGFALAGGVTMCIEARRDYERKKAMDRMSQEFDDTINTINNVTNAARNVCRNERN